MNKNKDFAQYKNDLLALSSILKNIFLYIASFCTTALGSKNQPHICMHYSLSPC